MSEMDVKSIYSNRFLGQLVFRRAMLQVLCHVFLHRFFPPEGTVPEIGAGSCEFINSILAMKKIPVDINPDMANYADPDVQVIQSASTDLSEITSASVDCVFTSNFFEHLSRPEILVTLAEIRRILRPGGMIVILQPNFHSCYENYYKFLTSVLRLNIAEWKKC